MKDYSEPRFNVCYKHFRKSQIGRIYRLKYCGGKMAPFPRPADIVDVVSPGEFRIIEPFRIPLFLGSQFGVSPRLESVLDPALEYLIAVYSKSLLSGLVSGLYFYRLRSTDYPSGKNCLLHFNNY